jgi:uncharacterized protein YcaQ
VNKARVAAALGQELARMARWLELPRVEVSRKGDLAGQLATRMRALHLR